MGILQKLEERYLFAPKILYFVINMQYYTLHQFRSVFAREKFLVSNSQYGRLTGIIMFVTFFTNIFIGGISDRAKNHRKVLFILTVFTAVFFGIFYIPQIMGVSGYTFWSVLLLYLVFNNPKQPLLDKIMLDYLGRMSAGPKVYGKQRLWGTIAYGAATYISEWCLMAGSNKEKDSKYNFDNLLGYCGITTLLAALAIVFLIRNKSPEATAAEAILKESHEQAGIAEDAENTTAPPAPAAESPAAPEGSESGYITLLKNKEFLFFIIIMFSNAVTRSAMSLYLTTYHREVLKLKPYDLPDAWPAWLKSTVSLLNDKPITTLTFFGIAFEIIVMFVSEGILRHLGLFWPLLLAQVCSLFRFFAYYFMSNGSPHVYGLSCLFELIKGIYFGMAHISAVQIATRLAPPHLKATSQMIYQGTFNALGTLVSGLLFGAMFDAKLKNKSEDGKDQVFESLFLLNGFICFCTILVYIYKYGVRDRVLFNRETEEAKLGMQKPVAVE